MKKRKILSLLSLGAVALSLAACGGGQKKTDSSKSEKVNDKVSVEEAGDSMGETGVDRGEKRKWNLGIMNTRGEL